ncbi:basic salivary proline-rich protein 2-like, partial [Penaeus monodon]|uniref:basic salivary proline-rich protein 2-like n=1 Tax=Penaeus monodon TaxID=6687 RepID=UPI0018A73B9C
CRRRAQPRRRLRGPVLPPSRRGRRPPEALGLPPVPARPAHPAARARLRPPPRRPQTRGAQTRSHQTRAAETGGAETRPAGAAQVRGRQVRRRAPPADRRARAVPVGGQGPRRRRRVPGGGGEGRPPASLGDPLAPPLPLAHRPPGEGVPGPPQRLPQSSALNPRSKRPGIKGMTRGAEHLISISQSTRIFQDHSKKTFQDNSQAQDNSSLRLAL